MKFPIILAAVLIPALAGLAQAGTHPPTTRATLVRARGDGTGGHGGNDVELKFMVALTIAVNMAEKRPEPSAGLVRTLAKIKNDFFPPEPSSDTVRIIATDELLYDLNGDLKIALNFPDDREIWVNRCGWSAAKPRIQEGISLHEAFGIETFELDRYTESAAIIGIDESVLENDSTPAGCGHSTDYKSLEQNDDGNWSIVRPRFKKADSEKFMDLDLDSSPSGVCLLFGFPYYVGESQLAGMSEEGTVLISDYGKYAGYGSADRAVPTPPTAQSLKTPGHAIDRLMCSYADTHFRGLRSGVSKYYAPSTQVGAEWVDVWYGRGQERWSEVQLSSSDETSGVCRALGYQGGFKNQVNHSGYGSVTPVCASIDAAGKMVGVLPSSQCHGRLQLECTNAWTAETPPTAEDCKKGSFGQCYQAPGASHEYELLTPLRKGDQVTISIPKVGDEFFVDTSDPGALCTRYGFVSAVEGSLVSEKISGQRLNAFIGRGGELTADQKTGNFHRVASVSCRVLKR